MVTLVNVRVKATDQNGEPVAKAPVTAKLNWLEVDADAGYILPEQINAITDVNGEVVLSLWPNALGATASQYDIKITNPDTGKTARLSAVIPNRDCELHLVAGLPFNQAAGDAPVAMAAAVAEVFAAGDALAQGKVDGLAAQLAAASGSTRSGHIAEGQGAVPRPISDVLNEFISPAGYGAALDGVTNDSAWLQAAVLACAINGGGTVRLPDRAPHKIKLSVAVKVPGYVTIDLNGYTVYGFGIGANYVFESAYLSDGELISNVGTPARSHNVLNMRIINGLIVNAKGIRRQDCLDACEVSRVGYTNCTEGQNDTGCFYSINRALMSRGSAGLSELPAYKFNDNVNAQIFDGISAVGRYLGYEFSGGINGASLRAVNAESGRVGLRFKDQVSAMNIDSCYIEAQETVGLDFTEAVGKENMSANNNYFNSMPVGIWGNQMRSGVTIGRGNHFVNTAVWVRINDIISAATVEVLDTVDVGNGLPRIRPEYQLGPRINVVGRNLITSQATGLPIGCNIVNAGIVPLNYGGDVGYSAGEILFCTVSTVATTGAKFNVVIDSEIVFNPEVMYMFSFTITDNEAAWKYWGEGSGTDILMKKPMPAGKNFTVSNNDGKLRLTVGEHSHPSGTYNAAGIVRIP